VLALARVAEGGRVIGVEPNTTVGGLLIDCQEDRTLQANAPAEVAGAIRGSLGSTALVAVVELRREPVADESA